jgi:urease accessory protein
MNNPFTSSSKGPGQGTLVVARLPPSTPVIKTLAYTYPLKLISPSFHPDSRSILVFLLTYGGGLVAGDSIHLSIKIEADVKVSLVTQGSTKLFKSLNHNVVSGQQMNVAILEHGSLCYLPDPVQPFDESVFVQSQTFKIHPTNASVCILDWVSEGRTARGEKWGLWKWHGKNEFWSSSEEDDGRLLLRDSVLLDSADGVRVADHLRDRMDDMGVFGTLMLRGPVFSSLSQSFLQDFEKLPRIGGRNWGNVPNPALNSPMEARRVQRQRLETDGGVVWTAASVRGFVLVKFGAKAVEGARHWLGAMLRDEGSIEREFGEGALLCLR